MTHREVSSSTRQFLYNSTKVGTASEMGTGNDKGALVIQPRNFD